MPIEVSLKIFNHYKTARAGQNDKFLSLKQRVMRTKARGAQRRAILLNSLAETTFGIIQDLTLPDDQLLDPFKRKTCMWFHRTLPIS